jgi:hypothetical protein
MFGFLIEELRLEAKRKKEFRSVTNPKGRGLTREKIKRYRGLTKQAGEVDRSTGMVPGNGRKVDGKIHDRASEASGQGRGYGSPGNPNIGGDEIRALRKRARAEK